MKQHIDTNSKQNPKLCQRQMKDGRISLYLEYYLGRTEEPLFNEDGTPIYYEGTTRQKYKVVHLRKKESLNIYLYATPKTAKERQENKDNIAIANQVRSAREEELRAGKLGYRIRAKEINFIDFLDNYYNTYTKSDVRVISGVITRFKAFLTEVYPLYDKSITPDKITRDMCEKFAEFLTERSKGDGAHSYFARFKKIIHAAVRQDILEKNPCEDVRCGVSEETIKKDILSQEEMLQLLSTEVPRQNLEIRRAFTFSLYAGLRYCDVKSIEYRNIDYANHLLTFRQNKTQGHSKSATVTIPLNETLLTILGEPKRPNDKVFQLPSHTMCQKSVKRWVERAGINKHITWHCARHSFAVNILTNGANIKVVADLLGHSSLKHTEKYTRAVDAAKQAAIESLPELPEIKK